MIYKHAISTVVPARPVRIPYEDRVEDRIEDRAEESVEDFAHESRGEQRPSY